MGKDLEVSTKIFDNPSDYDSYLKRTDVWSGHRSSRALGMLRRDKSAEVLIDKSYYLSGGISEDQLLAIAIHEQIELTSKSKDAHLEATVGEYQYIYNQSGADGLKQYHSRLSNLMGGDNSVRIRALKQVLSVK